MSMSSVQLDGLCLPRKRLCLGFVTLCALTVLLGFAYHSVGNPALISHAMTSSLSSAASSPGLQVRVTPAGLPMILHFVFKDTNLLEAYRSTLESCIRLNSNWTVILWTDSSVRSFIGREYPHYMSVFYAFPEKIQRSDAIRYLILYRFGGVYLDLDMRCRQPLLSSLSNIPCFLDREREHQTRAEHALKYSVMNSAMGCRPRHPFFKQVLDFVLHSDRLKTEHKFPYSIFYTTGPMALTQLYDQWRATNAQPVVTLLSASYFSPNISPHLYRICRQVVRTMDLRKHMTEKQKACLELQMLGFEKSDAAFITNVTVAIHEFTHLGYQDQKSKKFDVLKLHPRVRLYPNIDGLVDTLRV